MDMANFFFECFQRGLTAAEAQDEWEHEQKFMYEDEYQQREWDSLESSYQQDLIDMRRFER